MNKKNKYQTVMVFGTFDILHLGHIYLFEQAKKIAKKLIVIVARDNNVKKIKKQLPWHSEKERLKLLKQIKLIDEVCLGQKTNPYLVIKKYQPDVILLGYDQNVFVQDLQVKIKEMGLKTKIKRARAFKNSRFKTKILKYYYVNKKNTYRHN